MTDATPDQLQRLQRFPQWVRDLVGAQARRIATLEAKLKVEPHEGDVWLADPYGDEIPIHGNKVHAYYLGLVNRHESPVGAYAEITVQPDGLFVVRGGDAVKLQPLGGNSFSFAIAVR